MRAFYCIPELDWEEAEQPGDVVVVSRANGIVALLAPTDPHPALEAIGAERVGTRIADLEPDAAPYFTTSTVLREDEKTKDPVELTIATVEKLDGDEDIAPPTPRVIFAGDDPADYL